MFVDFSYDASGSNSDRVFGRPYGKCDTFRHILDDEHYLQDELHNYAAGHPDTDVYLVGHSQGGAIALGYLACFDRMSGTFTDIAGGLTLRGVVRLDSPLGGFDGTTADVGGAQGPRLPPRPGRRLRRLPRPGVGARPRRLPLGGSRRSRGSTAGGSPTRGPTTNSRRTPWRPASRSSPWGILQDRS